MIRPWKTLRSIVVFENSHVRVIEERVELPTGDEINYFTFERPDIALTFALTIERQVVLVRQYKHGAREVTLELPGGGVNPDEEPIVAAIRELEEETGFVSTTGPELLGSFYDDATKNRNVVHVVICERVHLSGRVALDGNEAAGGVEVELVPLDGLLGLIRSGQIRAESSVAGIYRALDHLGIN